MMRLLLRGRQELAAQLSGFGLFNDQNSFLAHVFRAGLFTRPPTDGREHGACTDRPTSKTDSTSMSTRRRRSLSNLVIVANGLQLLAIVRRLVGRPQYRTASSRMRNVARRRCRPTRSPAIRERLSQARDLL